MRPVVGRATSLLAGCVLGSILFAAAAFAQTLPNCNITGPTEVDPGQAFTLCGTEGNFFYEWFNPQMQLINNNRCLSFPNGLSTPGVYTYEFRENDGVNYSKCPVTIVVRKLPPPPPNGACWLTGGGAKFISEVPRGPQHSFGGNINPGCSPTAGDGGNWNDVWHNAALHFQGTTIQVVECGNVVGIPPGSTSPATPFNYIDFRGTGHVEGVQGNKASYPNVYFFGHYEDRAEPGSSGQSDPNARDRYFLHVYTNQADPAGSTVMLVDQDGNPNTVDPVIVTKGNLQIHISSCEDVAGAGALSPTLDEDVADAASSVAEMSISAAGNPTSSRTLLRFGMPRDGNASVRIYDVVGREVRELASGWTAAGQHSVAWDLKNRAGERVARGVYFARFAAQGSVRSQAIVVSH